MEQERILHMMQSGRVPHALLISGPAGSGRKALARRAAAIWCIGADAPAQLAACPNYKELAARETGVEAVRELIALSAVQGFNGGRRVFVLPDAHRLTVQAQNALLKTLEEPPEDTVLILTGSESGLLPTIRSRCTVFRLGHTPIAYTRDMLLLDGVDAPLAEAAARLADGVPGLAATLALERSRDLLAGAAECLSDTLFSLLPFSRMSALLATPQQEAEAKAAKGKKDEKKKPDMANAQDIVFYWQLLLGDALLLLAGGAPRATEYAALSAKIAQRFTISQIQGMIKNTIETEKQLRMNANPGQTMDAALVLLHDKEMQSWQM